MDTKLNENITQHLPRNWIISFVKSINSCRTASLYFHFFFNIWRMHNMSLWSVVALLCRNSHWCSQIISSAYGINLDSRINFVPTWQKWYAPIITTVCLIALLIDRYSDRLLLLLRQFLLILNRNNKFVNPTANYSAPCFNQFCWYLINTWWFVPF